MVVSKEAPVNPGLFSYLPRGRGTKLAPQFGSGAALQGELASGGRIRVVEGLTGFSNMSFPYFPLEPWPC